MEPGMPRRRGSSGLKLLPPVALVACALSALTAPAGAQTSSDQSPALKGLEPSLVKAIHDYDAAQIHGDRAELERLVAADYLIVRPRGTGDRASLIQGMTHAGMKLEPFTVMKPFTRNYGTTVVTGGWAALKGVDGGKPFEEKFRFSDVWSKRGGRWYVVMTQLTPSDTP